MGCPAQESEEVSTPGVEENTQQVSAEKLTSGVEENNLLESLSYLEAFSSYGLHLSNSLNSNNQESPRQAHQAFFPDHD